MLIYKQGRIAILYSPVKSKSLKRVAKTTTKPGSGGVTIHVDHLTVKIFSHLFSKTLLIGTVFLVRLDLSFGCCSRKVPFLAVFLSE